jgi:hypothetical protein
MTPHEYVMRMRIKRARNLLAQSNLPLVEIAARVGFSDQSQFTNNFRKFTSVTPKAYRTAAMNGIVTSDTRLGERAPRRFPGYFEAVEREPAVAVGYASLLDVLESMAISAPR